MKPSYVRYFQEWRNTSWLFQQKDQKVCGLFLLRPFDVEGVILRLEDILTLMSTFLISANGGTAYMSWLSHES